MKRWRRARDKQEKRKEGGFSKSPKSERRKESVAGQCRMRREVSWDGCPQALQEGFPILPILGR